MGRVISSGRGGGPITVTVVDDRDHVGWAAAARALVVTVKDNGPGMSEARARWLFEQDPASGRSAGLALVMVRDVAEAHGGSVAVESHLGKGSTFTLRIPCGAHTP